MWLPRVGERNGEDSGGQNADDRPRGGGHPGASIHQGGDWDVVEAGQRSPAVGAPGGSVRSRAGPLILLIL